MTKATRHIACPHAHARAGPVLWIMRTSWASILDRSSVTNRLIIPLFPNGRRRRESHFFGGFARDIQRLLTSSPTSFAVGTRSIVVRSVPFAYVRRAQGRGGSGIEGCQRSG